MPRSPRDRKIPMARSHQTALMAGMAVGAHPLPQLLQPVASQTVEHSLARMSFLWSWCVKKRMQTYRHPVLEDQTAALHLCLWHILPRKFQAQRSWPYDRCLVPSFSFHHCTSELQRGRHSCQAPSHRLGPPSMPAPKARRQGRWRRSQAHLLPCPWWRNQLVNFRSQETSGNADPQAQWMPSLLPGWWLCVCQGNIGQQLG